MVMSHTMLLLQRQKAARVPLKQFSTKEEKIVHLLQREMRIRSYIGNQAPRGGCSL